MIIHYICAEDADGGSDCSLFVASTCPLKAVDLWLEYAKDNFSTELELKAVYELPHSNTILDDKVLPWSDLDGVVDLLTMNADLAAHVDTLVSDGEIVGCASLS